MEKRLQSIKLPRDLTLGGTKPRKTFAPNLNVARNKEKNKELFIKTEDKQKRNNKRDYKNNKKFERPERFVQSSGIFSDGVGFEALRKARSERLYAPKDEGAMPMPKVKKDEWQVDNKNETRVYDDIMGGNDVSDEDEKLPFAPISWDEANLKETKVPMYIKPEVKVEHSESLKLDLDRLKIESSIMPQEFQETENFSDYKPALSLWSDQCRGLWRLKMPELEKGASWDFIIDLAKMPDSFAGKGLSDDPTVKTLFDYKLSEMLEGQIGKMSIRKSGRVEVFIGCVKYQIEPAELESATERIVELDVKPASGSMGVALGQLKNRFILNPDWAYLLTNS